MDKTLAFELIAGSWATVTVIMMMGFLNAMRQDIEKFRIDFSERLTKIDDRLYDLSKQGGNYEFEKRTG